MSNVTNLQNTFRDAVSFNQPLNSWDVSEVNTLQSTFAYASSFNQSLNSWNVSTVNTLQSTFQGASNFNQPLNSWDVANVTRMNHLFEGTKYNYPLDSWDTGNVDRMHFMFHNNVHFNQDISMWNTSSVNAFYGMFSGATSFNQDISSWDISNVNIPLSDSVSVFDLESLGDIFYGVALDQSYIDAILLSWSQQAVDNTIENIPFHLGLKTYSQNRAASIGVLESLGWTVTEQYKASYSPTLRATLIGAGTQGPLSSGDTTTGVEIKPDRNCSFMKWSDGNTDNPRQDTLTTDNLTVEAVLSCSSIGGGATLATRIANLEKHGNQTEADKLKQQFLPSMFLVTLNDTLIALSSLLEQLSAMDPADQEKINELTLLLLELMKVISQLLVSNTQAT